MLKKITIIAVGLALLLALLAVRWMQNPYGLEPERLAPRGGESVGPVDNVPDAKNYLIFPHYEDNAYAVHLALPNHYIHPSNYSSQLLKTYGVSASMYYPNLNGKFHPENTNLPECNGYCAGLIRLSVAPSNTRLDQKHQVLLGRIAQERQQGSELYKFEDLGMEFGIDEHFQIRYQKNEAAADGSKALTKEYLIKRDSNGNIEYLFVCSPYTPSPSCGVAFDFSLVPELEIDIRFSRNLMPKWPAIIKSVDEKVASWKPAKIETHQN